LRGSDASRMHFAFGFRLDRAGCRLSSHEARNRATNYERLAGGPARTPGFSEWLSTSAADGRSKGRETGGSVNVGCIVSRAVVSVEEYGKTQHNLVPDNLVGANTEWDEAIQRIS
jgi:hypothetical protein